MSNQSDLTITSRILMTMGHSFGVHHPDDSRSISSPKVKIHPPSKYVSMLHI